MITVVHKSNDSGKIYYYVYKNTEFISLFYWKWCAIRFAKKLAKFKPTNVVVFTIN